MMKKDRRNKSYVKPVIFLFLEMMIIAIIIGMIRTANISQNTSEVLFALVLLTNPVYRFLLVINRNRRM